MIQKKVGELGPHKYGTSYNAQKGKNTHTHTLEKRGKMGGLMIMYKFLNRFDEVNIEQFIEIKNARSIRHLHSFT